MLEGEFLGGTGMRLGLYGLPSAGKTYIEDKLKNIPVKKGSILLNSLCPDFSNVSEKEKDRVRRKLASDLKNEESFLMDGHYAFGDKVVFTEQDGQLYDAIVYLYCKPGIIQERMSYSDKNRVYLNHNIKEWQDMEIRCLRDYCHKNNMDFYVIDEWPAGMVTDIAPVIEFLEKIFEGYSPVKYAKDLAREIMAKTDSDTISLIDGDRTLIEQDSSVVAFGYRTHIFDGNYYTGYQAFLQWKEFLKIGDIKGITDLSVSTNERVLERVEGYGFIISSGNPDIWSVLSKRYGMDHSAGYEICAETKYYLTRFLKDAGRNVVGFGDSMSDLFMLKAADKGYLVRRNDGSLSRSLTHMDLGGLEYV